jgi:hypothetical protein
MSACNLELRGYQADLVERFEAGKTPAARTREERRLTSLRAAELMTPEQRSERARKANEALTAEQRSEKAQKVSAARRAKKDAAE